MQLFLFELNTTSRESCSFRAVCSTLETSETSDAQSVAETGVCSDKVVVNPHRCTNEDFRLWYFATGAAMKFQHTSSHLSARITE